MIDIMPFILAFIFGAVWGSFLNVCISRLPQELSIVTPGSHCMSCQKPVMWCDNIPILSFLLLKGKCRYCQAPIGFRYFLIEVFCGLLAVSCLHFYGWTPMAWKALIFFLLLLAISVTDFETGLIPDELSFFGMAAGLFFNTLFPELIGKTIWYEGLKESALGLLSGGILLYVMAIIGDFVFKKESMGGGDIKLLAMIGAFVGFRYVFSALLFAPFFALPMALYAKFFKKFETIPFGPYLALGGIWVFLFGDGLLIHI